MPKELRLAIDIGGTFTDTVLAGPDSAVIASAKTLTTHDNPATGAMEGAVHALGHAGVELGAVTGFVHGTTLATNALIEKRGARVAVVTTEGFRDILEIAYERRYSQYDIDLEKPDLLVPRDRVFTVPERMSFDGKQLVAIEEKALPGLLSMLDASGADAVAICLLHAYANPEHERRLASWLGQVRPDLSVTLSSEVSPEAREFDRMCTTVANAFVQPLMSRYLREFESAFREAGLTCPILMMTAGGGMCTLDTAARIPIRLVESGPAGGAILAARIAAELGLDQVLSFDMGGTTAKLCLIDGARPQNSRQFEIARAARFIKGSGMPVRIPVIEMIEIGAGGGSVAGVDRLGRLTVGPESAGSDPGPVAFGRGGTHPTVTDADVTLGYIRPESFAEGRLEIDAPAAAAALINGVGTALGLDAQAAADGVSRIVDEAMASAGRMHAVESGKDLGPRTMIAFGGNGPLHAGRVARMAGVSRIVIPRDPGVGSAVGFLHAPVAFETVRSWYTRLERLDIAGLNALLSRMQAEALDVVRQGAPDTVVAVQRTAFMRYHGQGHEIEISLPGKEITADTVKEMQAAFDAEYARQFSRTVPGMSIEILNWAVRVSTPNAPPVRAGEQPRDHRPDPVRTVLIRCDLTGQDLNAVVFDRGTLVPGDVIPGPALVTEPQTTTFLGADFTARVDGRGNLILTQKSQGET